MHDDGRFEWDEDKAVINVAKHGVSFEEARFVFDDPHEVEFFDRNHSDDEPRFVRIGMSDKRLLLVIFTIREDRTRIIHARKANKLFERMYAEKIY
jgi:uncharacterized protein